MDTKQHYEILLKIQNDTSDIKSDIKVIKATTVTCKSCFEDMEKHENKFNTKITEIEDKIKPIERFQYKLLGAFALGLILIKFV